MRRLRLYDLRMSRLPSAIGVCREDRNKIADYVNSAQERLLMGKEAGEEGWWGTWAEMAFNISRTNPFITAPRSVARISFANVCQEPVTIQNQFYEYLDFGNGRMPKLYTQTCDLGIMEGLTRNNVVTFVDKPAGTQIIRIYSADATDDEKRVLIQGTDQNDKVIYSRDGINKVVGVFVGLQAPFVDCPIPLNTLTGIQKDITDNELQFYAVDPVTGAETLIHTMEPSEETAQYRRVYFDGLPRNCCAGAGTGTTVQVTAICKLDLIPVQVDTDYCLIQSREAIIAECQSIRDSERDGAEAKQASRERHNAAVALLNGEIAHFIGTEKPAISFAPFGSASLERQRIGTMF